MHSDQFMATFYKCSMFTASVKSVKAASIFHLHVSCLESFMATRWQRLVAVLLSAQTEMLKCLQAGVGWFKCLSDSVLIVNLKAMINLHELLHHVHNHFCGLWLVVRKKEMFAWALNCFLCPVNTVYLLICVTFTCVRSKVTVKWIA